MDEWFTRPQIPRRFVLRQARDTLLGMTFGVKPMKGKGTADCGALPRGTLVFHERLVPLRALCYCMQP